MKADVEEIRLALSLLAEPDQIVELRLLKVQLKGHRMTLTMSGYFDDHSALAAAAAEHCMCSQGAYVTLNPLNPVLLARAANRIRIVGKGDVLTSDMDITRRRWLPLDFDPIRPSGISASQEEHSAAIARAREVQSRLRADGWPDPILADSGNGAHLLYSVDLPTEDGDLVKGCLRGLARRFDDDVVKIDQAVFNPARIWKLYGTFSRKGDNLPDRPHRLARILEAP